jgi:beta-barrel assembly-enhancing protease
MIKTIKNNLVKIFKVVFIILFPFILNNCQKDSRSNGGINIFTIDDDEKLGLQVSREIESKPLEYPVLSPLTYANAYTYLLNMRNEILATHLVAYDTVFPWSVRIIHNDSVVNAFCTPGGYVYIYTGLIKVLSNEAELAGVMGHEMAHAANRHSTNQLTQAYGIEILLSALGGKDTSIYTNIAKGLASGLATLAFSRQDEYQADEYAVKYLYATSYDALSLEDFFTLIEGLPRPPTFLSTHPSPTDRKTKIEETFNNLGGKHGQTYQTRYQQLKAALP